MKRAPLLSTILITSSLLLPAFVSAQGRGWGGASAAELQAGADRGDKRAQLELGKRYEGGIGLPTDLRKAERLYNAAAIDSDSSALIYVPASTLGGSGRVSSGIGGVVEAKGLPEAAERLKALRRRLGECKKSPVKCYKQVAPAPNFSEQRRPNLLVLTAKKPDALKSYVIDTAPWITIDLISLQESRSKVSGVFRGIIDRPGHHSVSYYRLEANCKKRLYRYAGDGDDLQSALVYNDDSEFSSFPVGSDIYQKIKVLCPAG